MKNRGAILLLLVVIGVLVAVNVLLDRYGRSQEAFRMARETLMSMEGDIVSLSIKNSDGSAVTIDGEQGWRITGGVVPGKADLRVVKKMIDVLAFTPIVDRISQRDLQKRGKGLEDFGLEIPRSQVTIAYRGSAGKDEHRFVRLMFGNDNATTNGVYAMQEGVEMVYVVPRSVYEVVKGDVNRFRDARLFALDGKIPSELEIRRETEAPIIFKKHGGIWKAGESYANNERLDGFIQQLITTKICSHVRVLETESESAEFAIYGFTDDEVCRVILKDSEGIIGQIAMGKLADEKTVYALAGRSVVTIDAALKQTVSSGIEALLDNRLFPIAESEVQRVMIADGDNICALAKDVERKWRLEMPITAPADQEKVSAMISRLLRLEVGEAYENGVTVSVSTNLPSAKIAAKVVMGEGTLAELRSKEILGIAAGGISRIVRIAGTNRTAVTYARETQRWNLEQGSGLPDEENIAAIVKVFENLRAVRIVKLKAKADELAEFGLEHPLFTMAVDCADENSSRRNLLIGGDTDGGKFATIGSSEAIFVLDEKTVSVLKIPITE